MPRKYPAEVRRQVIELARSGTKIAQLAAAFGMTLGEVALNSAVLSPAYGDEVRAGKIEVRGYAFAGGVQSVERVDVSADGGETRVRAELGEDLGRWAWRTWRAEADLGPGEVEILSRAWDRPANLQPERPESLWNPKGYVNSSWVGSRFGSRLLRASRRHFNAEA